MSGADDDDEIPVVEKLYCCGNSSQRESTYISRLDLGLAVLEFLCVLSFSVVFAGIPDLLIDTVPRLAQYRALSDFEDFLKLEALTQWGILVGWNLLLIVEICLAILLACGSQQRRRGLIRIWFCLTILSTLGQVSLQVYLATVSRALIFHIVYPIVFFLYKWYSLWIAWVLMRRIRLIEAGYENPSDDEFQEIQLQPQPQFQEDKL